MRTEPVSGFPFTGQLLAALVLCAACTVALSSTQAQSQSATKNAGAAAERTSAKGHRHPVGEMPESARQHYELTYGVDQLSVKLAESGQVVRFSYRVTDAQKAGILHNRASTPYLLDEKMHAVLQVPVMEKVGPLRQSTPPENGKSYWMVFSNKGKIVGPGHRVSVTIGSFRVDGLIVQ